MSGLMRQQQLVMAPAAADAAARAGRLAAAAALLALEPAVLLSTQGCQASCIAVQVSTL